MKRFSIDHKYLPNQHKNSYNLSNETNHPVLSLVESQWELRQRNDQNFMMEEKPL